MNRVILIGRLTKDPEVREGSTTYCRFSIAVDRKKDGVDFINCVAFGKTADFIGRYFAKGKKIALTGRIQTGSYTNRDGKKVETVDVVADEVEFCEKRELDEPNYDQNFLFVPADDLDDPGVPFA